MKEFREYIKAGIIKKRSPQIARARSLVDEAYQRKKFLENLETNIPLTNSNANYFIENAYDILIELTRAKLIKDGYYSSGKGAHEAEIAYLSILGFPEKEVRIFDSLRERRNGIKYYGEECDADYARRVIAFCKKMYPRLRKLACR